MGHFNNVVHGCFGRSISLKMFFEHNFVSPADNRVTTQTQR